MAAEVISAAGIEVDLYDAMPSVGRKFLLAGKGGMNITHSEPYEKFLSRYGSGYQFLKPVLSEFTPQQLREWVSGLGILTFIGTSGRVFPVAMKAAPLLRGWLHRLRLSGVNIHVRHRWIGWSDADNSLLMFATPQGNIAIHGDAVVLALGGASWPQLGSTGDWVTYLIQRNVAINPLVPANCGFDVHWSAHFQGRFSGLPVKSVAISYNKPDGEHVCQRGELLIANTGLEGSLIYAHSAFLREQIALYGFVDIYLDLLPDQELEWVLGKMSQPKGKLSIANQLRKRLGIDGVKAGLLREQLPQASFNNTLLLCSAIKALPIKLLACRPIAEAISSAGGIVVDAVNKDLMIKSLPGMFCAGEMLDWEAPTGGYLLTACLATGRRAGFGVLAYLNSDVPND